MITARLSASLPSDRIELERLVSAVSTVVRTKTPLRLPEAQIRFLGVIADTPNDILRQAIYAHVQKRRTILLVKPNHPKLILELESSKPIQIGRKMIRTINETARKQFSHSKPAVIWTHINFISDKIFLSLGEQKDGRACLFDGIADATLTSEKRNHLSQLVFSGGSFLDKTGSVARSSYRSFVYNSPICRFGKNVIFEDGRTHPDHKAA